MTQRAQAARAFNSPVTSAPARTTRLPEPIASGDTPGSASAACVTLDTIVAQVRHLPALPSVVLQVMRMTGEEGIAPREVARVISSDPNFAVRILQLANSAYYGLPRKVGTLSEAVVLLGMRTVRNIAIAAATHDTLTTELPGYELGRGDLWRHSLACALASQTLAEMARFPDPEEAFVAGLLHDIGKVVLSVHVQEAYDRILTRMDAEDLPFLDAERAVLGFDHAEVGGRVAVKWNLPSSLVQAIAWHHQPMNEGQMAPLTALIHVANAVCLMAGISLGADGLRAPISEAALNALHLTEAQIEMALDRLVTQMSQAETLFAS